MNIVFMGTPDFSVPILEKLIEKHTVSAVYTRAPKQSGRGKKVTKSPVHTFAENKGIEVRYPRTLRNEEEQNKLRTLKADVAIVAAYGLILPQEVLDMFPKGCINVHASLLPRWRGAAPIQRVIEAGDAQSGISIMKMALALDAGDVLSQDKVAITKQTTGEELHDKLSLLGADLLLKTLDELDTIHPQPQDESQVCYAEKITKEESHIDFNTPAEILERKIRAFSPFPAMYFIYHEERFKILQASVCERQGKAGEILEGHDKLIISTANKSLLIEKIQRAGKQPMCTQELLRGFKFEKIIIS